MVGPPDAADARDRMREPSSRRLGAPWRLRRRSPPRCGTRFGSLMSTSSFPPPTAAWRPLARDVATAKLKALGAGAAVVRRELAAA